MMVDHRGSFEAGLMLYAKVAKSQVHKSFNLPAEAI
jgi:hypothetical protein